ncbi:pilus assembly protein [Salmonella enterica subsp. enterica serovar Virchow]|nr:pilus assembly protein [Salmonella enterica subsp. enterica serovar Virchow]
MADMTFSQEIRTQVLRCQGQNWVTGLRWEEKKKTARRLALSAGRARGHHIILSVGSSGRKLPRQNRLTARGQTDTRYRHQALYSLAALFSQRCSPDGYGVYQSGDGRQVFLATVNGLPSLMADVAGEPERVARALALFLSFNPAPAQGWQVPSSPDSPLPLDELVRSATPAELRFARLSRASAPLLRCVAGMAGCGVLGGLLWWTLQPDTLPVPSPETVVAQAADIIRKPPPAPVYLPHPWADMPDVPAFLARCQRWRSAVPVSLDHWRLDRGHCAAVGLELVYTRLPGGTAERFATRALAVFNIRPVFNLTAGGNEGVVFIPWGRFDLRDEQAPVAAEQLMQAVSWFQSRQVAFSLAEVREEPALPGDGSSDTPPPVQDWREYTFSITEKRPPEWVLHGLDPRGVRLKTVAYTLSPQGQFTWQIEGHLYAKK